MIDKYYFKIEFFMKKSSMKNALDYIKTVNANKGIECIALQNIHTSKKVPELQVQVMGNDVVQSLVQGLTMSKYSHGYILWMSKQEDFFAAKSLHLLSVDYSNVINNADDDEKAKKTVSVKGADSNDK